MQTLHDLDLDAAQFELLRAAMPKLEDDPAPRAIDKPSVRSRVSAKYLATLESLRQALLHDNGPDAKEQIDELRDELESIREDEAVELDDRVSIVDAARVKTAEVMKFVRPGQVVQYLTAYQDEIPDPVTALVDAADESRGADDGKFNALAERTARDIGFLVIGLDTAKAAPVEDRVRQWLSQNRALSDAEFKLARPELEKAAKAAIGDFDSFDILRHWIERDVAELLSNPQTTAMIDERIKHAGK